MKRLFLSACLGLLAAFAIFIMLGGARSAVQAAPVPSDSDSSLRTATKQAQAASVLFDDDFEAGAGKWSVHSGDWAVVPGSNGTNVYSQTDMAGTTRSVISGYLPASLNWTDYAVQARVRPASGDKYAMLMLRYQGPGNYYLMALRMDSGKIEFKRMLPGGSIGLGSVNAGITAGNWYTATFEVVGNELRGYLNGNLMITRTNSALATGTIGVGTLDASAEFDNVVVTLVPTTLTVTSTGTGSGVVSSTPGGINCGITCTAGFMRGSVVTLTAAADSGDSFAGWMGPCTGMGACVVTMDKAKEVIAVFSSSSNPMLIAYKAGSGVGTVTSTPAGIDCGATCMASVASFTQDAVVTLTAEAETFSEFAGWSGAGCSGTDPCMITMNAAKNITATFTRASYPLTVIKAGNGSGTVTSNPPGIDCGITCTASMGGFVTLTATSDDALSSFTGWDGAGCSGTDPCAIGMDSAKSVTATFTTYINYLPVIRTHTDPVVVDPLYVAPGGSDSNPGTMALPFKTVSKAVSVAIAGQTIYMLDGTYYYTETVTLSKDGNAVNMYKIWAYPGEQPVLDFSGVPCPGTPPSCSFSRGFLINGTYWYLKGLEIQNAPDNGIKIDGSHNIVEQCVLHHNQDTGLQIGLGSSSSNPGGWVAAFNQVINCDSYRNFDQATNGSNADGFACKLHAGKGNSFTGCRAWENSDDGWDLFDTDYPVTIENSWTWHNGDKALWGVTGTWGGNGNGFKVGGNYDNAAHILTGCIAFDNAYESGKGFDENHNMSGISVTNSVAWGNLTNFSFNEEPNDGSQHVLKNNVSFDPVNADTNLHASTIQDHNSWNLITVTASITDFLSLDENLAKAPRQADGSLPDNGFARLAAGSDLIDAGVDVGLPYCGSAPDLGAFEYCPSPDQAQAPQPIDGILPKNGFASLVLGSGLVGLGAYGYSTRRRHAGPSTS